VLACDAHAPPEGEVLDLAESSLSGSLALRVGVILAGPFFLARDLSEDPFLLTMHESLEEEESESSLDWSSAAPPPEEASSFFLFWSFPVLTLCGALDVLEFERLAAFDEKTPSFDLGADMCPKTGD
jgi:hypothetical protein